MCHVPMHGMHAAYREVVAVVIGVNGKMQQILCVVVKGMAGGEIPRASWHQQPIDGIKPGRQAVDSLLGL